MSEFVADETFDWIKMNQKSVFVGTGAQATAFITNPQVGQRVYATEKDSNFAKDKLAVYGSNEEWLYHKVEIGDEESFGSISPVVADGNTGGRQYLFYQLPTTYKLYMITGYEFGRNTTKNARSVLCGVDLVDSITSTTRHSPMISLGGEILTDTSTASYRINHLWSQTIRGGSFLRAWISQDGGFGFGSITNATGNYANTDTYTGTPAYTASTGTIGYNASLSVPAFKVYYRGIN